MKRFISLSELKKYHLKHRDTGGPLKDMALFTRARLSVQPLSAGMYRHSPFNITRDLFFFLSSSCSSLQRSLTSSWVWRIKHLCEDWIIFDSKDLCLFFFILMTTIVQIISCKMRLSSFKYKNIFSTTSAAAPECLFYHNHSFIADCFAVLRFCFRFFKSWKTLDQQIQQW